MVAFAGMKNYLGFAKQTSGNLFVRPDFVGPSWTPTVERPGLPGVPVPRPYYFPFCARSLGQEQWHELADTFENNVRSSFSLVGMHRAIPPIEFSSQCTRRL